MQMENATKDLVSEGKRLREDGVSVGELVAGIYRHWSRHFPLLHEIRRLQQQFLTFFRFSFIFIRF